MLTGISGFPNVMVESRVEMPLYCWKYSAKVLRILLSEIWLSSTSAVPNVFTSVPLRKTMTIKSVLKCEEQT